MHLFLLIPGLIALIATTVTAWALAGATGLAFSPSNPRSYALRFSRTW